MRAETSMWVEVLQWRVTRGGEKRGASKHPARGADQEKAPLREEGVQGEKENWQDCGAQSRNSRIRREEARVCAGELLFSHEKKG